MSVAKQPVLSAETMDLLHAVCKIAISHSKADLDLHQLQSIDSSNIKEFCVGLLENPKTHPWNRALSRVEGRKALSVAGSLFLFRKALPAEWDENEMYRKHRAAMVPACRGDREPLPEGYIAHVRKIVTDQFKPGWDRSYTSHCWTSTPSVGSCAEASRSQGGTRSLKLDRRDFLEKTIGSRTFEVDPHVKYIVVPTGGKGRGVTIAPSDMNYLRPCHKTIYDHLSSLPWLLRGEAKPNSFRSFERKEGEVFVSGDYESASDNLRVSVADAILDVLQSTSRKIPASVWKAARAYLRCRISYPDVSEPMESEGQLMGNLLCFPLLCLQNYVAFRWVFGTDVPCKINGDDIVFRAPRSRYDYWASVVSSLGLKLSRGKTLVNEYYFSLNSAFFWSRPGRKPRPIPVSRVSCFAKKFEDWGSLAGSFRSFTRGFRNEALLTAEIFFLKRFNKRIRQAGRSVRRGLGIPCSIPSLQGAGLWRRECWYFSSVPAEADSLPDSPCRNKWCSVPKGWKRVTRSSVLLTGEVRFLREGESTCAKAPVTADELQRCFWSQVVSMTWTESPTRGKMLKDYVDEVRGTGWEGRYRLWRSRPAKPFLLRWTRPCPCGKCNHRGFRVDSRDARKWVPPKREPLIWAPFDQATIEEESWTCSVDDLVDYEPLSFAPPRGRSSLFKGRTVEVCADYVASDAKWGLGYR